MLKTHPLARPYSRGGKLELLQQVTTPAMGANTREDSCLIAIHKRNSQTGRMSAVYLFFNGGSWMWE